MELLSSSLLATERVLITGARGFLGSHLCSRLVKMGAEVYGVSRSCGDKVHDRIRWCEGDFSDIDTARRLITTVKPHVIFHLAGVVTALPDMSLVLPTMHSLLVSTVNTLIVASETGCRRVLLAASLTEPEASLKNPVPTSPYAAAKWAGTVYAGMFHQLYKTPVVVVRPFMTYGPMQDNRKLLPYVISSLLRGEAPRLSSGEWPADWIYVDDVTTGFVAAAITPGIEGSNIDLGSGTLFSVRNIVGKIVQLTEAQVQPIFGGIPDRPLEQVRPANCAESYRKLGWKPEIPLEEGLKRTVIWCRERLASSVLYSR